MTFMQKSDRQWHYVYVFLIKPRKQQLHSHKKAIWFWDQGLSLLRVTFFLSKELPWPLMTLQYTNLIIWSIEIQGNCQVIIFKVSNIQFLYLFQVLPFRLFQIGGHTFYVYLIFGFILLIFLSDPPTSAPLISLLPPGLIHNTGKNVTLSCQLSGGNPLATISLTCDGQILSQSNLNNETTAVSEVNFQIERSYNNRTCTCKGVHQAQLTDTSSSITLFVNGMYLFMHLYIW